MIPLPDSGRTTPGMVPCASTRERVHARHDGELASAECAALALHLAACAPCARAARAERGFLRRVRGRVGMQPAPASLRARVRAMLGGTA